VGGLLQIFRAERGWGELGWPAHASGGAIWLTPGAPVEALNVSREVGEDAVTRLRATDVVVPVINIPGPPDRRTLLMQPYEGLKGEVLAMFKGLDVGYAYLGHDEGRSSDWGIDLPPTKHHGHGALTWITMPENSLPPADVVVTVLADVLTS
jgi:hypothetical protein